MALIALVIFFCRWASHLESSLLVLHPGCLVDGDEVERNAVPEGHGVVLKLLRQLLAHVSHHSGTVRTQHKTKKEKKTSKVTPCVHGSTRLTAAFYTD